MTKAYRTLLENAFKAGSKKTIGAKLIENALHIPYETYCMEMIDMQTALHTYVVTQAMDDKSEGKADTLEMAKTAVYDKMKKAVERVPGILCEAGDILYLSLSAYKLAKSKDIERDDGSFSIGTKRLVNVSASSFRVIVESLLGNKIVGNTWDSGMGEFRAMTETERSKLDKKLEKKRQRETNASAKAKDAPKAKQTNVSQEKPKAEKVEAKHKGTSDDGKPTMRAKKEKSVSASKKPTTPANKKPVESASQTIISSDVFPALDEILPIASVTAIA